MVPPAGWMCDAGMGVGGDSDDKRRKHPPGIAQSLDAYEALVDQNRGLHHPPPPFASPPFPELEDRGCSTNTVLLNNPSSPVGSSGGKNLCLLSVSSSSPPPSRELTGADPARRNGFTLSFFGEGFVGVQSIASGSSTSFSSSAGGGGFWSEGEPKIGLVRIVSKGLFDRVKEPNRSDSCTRGCGFEKRGAGPGGREEERVVDAIVVGSMRRIEGGLTTLSVTKEMIRTYVRGGIHVGKILWK
jgi:hypothetical protein